MRELFLTILNMSITASVLIAAVLLLRIPLKRAPRWITVLLWGMAAIRLICPFTVESTLSLVPETEWVAPPYREIPPMTESAPDEITIPQRGEPVTIPPPAEETDKAADPVQICTILWAAGCGLMLLYTAATYAGLRHRVRTAVRLEKNIYGSEHAATPFVLGLIRPRIYLPFTVSEEDLPHIIAHERAHIRRGDHLWKPLGFLLLSIHWFNPLCWAGYILLCRDIEAACDERVIRTLPREARADYSQALLKCSVSRRVIAACPVAFGEVSVRDRVKTVLNYKKPTLWIIVAAVVLCIIAAACFLTNPMNKEIDNDLRVFLENEVIAYNDSPHNDGYKCFADIEVLGSNKRGSSTTLYTWALYKEYRFTGTPEQGCAAHIPTVFTVTKEGGEYRLDEYWTPRDGSYYAPDIKEKYPLLLWGKATDSVRYYRTQADRILEKVNRHFAGTEYLTEVFTDGISGAVWKAAELEWVNLSYSSLVPNDPDIRIQVTAGKTLFVKNDLLVNRGSNMWFSLSELEEISLSEEDMEELFLIDDAGWVSTSAEEIRKNNDKAWLVTSGRYAYLLLLQKDGTVYLGLGYAGEEGSILRCFYRMTTASGEIHSDPRFEHLGYYGTAYQDIDGDGKEDSLILGRGHTSGVFTFTLTAYDKGSEKVKYERTFCTEWYDLSFTTKDGVLKVQGITQDNPPETHLFDIVVTDGVLDLTENGVPITGPWNTGADTTTYALPDELRERIFTAFLGERASDMAVTSETQDIWTLGKGGDADYYQYQTVPDIAGTVFNFSNRNLNLNFLDENLLDSDELSPLTLPESEANVLCHNFLAAVDPVGTYQPTGTAVYGKTGTPFYTIRWERIGGSVTEGAFDNFLFYVTNEGIGHIRGVYSHTPPVSFTAVIRKWSEEADGFLGILELDLVEYITDRDTARIEALGLTEQDLLGGYYILNSEDKATMLKIPTGSEFVFYDWGDDFKEDPRCDSYEKRWVTTKDISLFIDYLETYNKATHGMESHPRMPFIIEEINGTVRITEIFLM